MWKSPKLAVGSGQNDLTDRNTSMAQRKGLVTARVGGFLVAGLVLAILLAGRVALLNQMTSMRTNIAVLEDRKGFLETNSASLLARWNHETSASVLCARAEKRLGLIRPAEPGLVLVKLSGEDGNSRWGWPSWLEGLAGGDPAHAQGFQQTMQVDTMIHLQPVGRVAQPNQEQAH